VAGSGQTNVIVDRTVGVTDRKRERAASFDALLGAMEGLVRLQLLTTREHPDWGDYRCAMERDRRGLLRIRVDRVAPNCAG
jgi:hypothetical protein